MRRISFEIVIPPIGKPRMTRSDCWRKRPAVIKYFAWANEIKLTSLRYDMPKYPISLEIVAHIPVPKSWSQKKKEEKNGKLHDEKPDWDNIGKAVCDALFVEDKTIGRASVEKYWSIEPGKINIVVIGEDDKPL